jgi:hypothetical protein
LEEALTRRFGLQWVARDDGHGYEIKGISGEMMRLFSTRRESINADVRARAAQFEQRYGRAPSQRELAQLAQASNFTTRKAKDGALDFTQLHNEWADKLARTLGVPLASVAPSVWHTTAQPPGRNARTTVLTELEMSRAAQKAVALAQQEMSSWTRADLVKYLAACCLGPAWSQPRPRPCSRTWSTARCARSSRRFCAWRRRRLCRFRAACCAPTGAASTSGTEERGTPPARSWPWKSACSRKPA